MTVNELDTLPREEAARALTACCGSSRWVGAMLARRPFASADALLTAADEVWRSLNASDWLEAFSHHPRIGERASATPQSERARSWSAGEQSSVATTDERARSELAEINREYEQRFGFIYIVCATGKSPSELLEIARQRLHNDRDTELRVAAEEQRKITRLRLEKLLTPEPAA